MDLSDPDSDCDEARYHNKMQNAGKDWNKVQMQVEGEVTSVSCGNL